MKMLATRMARLIHGDDSVIEINILWVVWGWDGV